MNESDEYVEVFGLVSESAEQLRRLPCWGLTIRKVHRCVLPIFDGGWFVIPDNLSEASCGLPPGIWYTSFAAARADVERRIAESMTSGRD